MTLVEGLRAISDQAGASGSHKTWTVHHMMALFRPLICATMQKIRFVAESASHIAITIG